MKERQYISLNNKLNESKGLKKAVVLVDRIITLLILISYPISIVILEFLRSDKIFMFVIVPFCAFILTSIFRAALNAKRPYENMDIKVLTKIGNKKGNSFPSRHVFSAFMISFAFFYVNIIVGIVGIILSLILCVTRVLTGEHYIKDVLAGIAFGAFFALIGFVVIPF